MGLSGGLDPRIPDVITASQQAAAAALAGGIIAASGKHHNLEEAKAVYEDAFWTLFPSPNHGRYNTWLGEKAARDARYAKP